MSEQGGRGAVVNAVVNGVVTGIWYSLPDAVSSRPARGWLKVAVLVGGSLSIAYATRASQAADAHTDGITDGGDNVDADGSVDDGGNPSGTEADLGGVSALMATEPVIDAEALGLGGGSPNRARQVGVAGVVVAALIVAGTVAGERAIHRWGERLTARGVRGAHTRIGLVAGVLTGVGTWLSERSLRTTSAPS